MTRKIGFVSLLMLAFIVVACGRQVTPNPPGLGAGGAPPGFMAITFDVAGQFNFSSYQYWIVFNTTGNNQTPSTLPLNNNWAGYSFAIEVGGPINGGTNASAIEFIRSTINPHVPPTAQALVVPPTLMQYNPNSNGSGTEFTVIFSRSLFRGISPSSSPSPTPTARPTTTPKSSATPSPTPTPSAAPNQIWYFNAFTTQANAQNQWVFVDSLGVGGPQNPQFVSPALNTLQSFNVPEYGKFLGAQIDPAAQIVQVTIGNNP